MPGALGALAPLVLSVLLCTALAGLRLSLLRLSLLRLSLSVAVSQLLFHALFLGGIAWSAGELPMVLIALVVLTQWMRSDERAARGDDRRADRNGDAELSAYNSRLGDLERRSTASAPAAPSLDCPTAVRPAGAPSIRRPSKREPDADE